MKKLFGLNVFLLAVVLFFISAHTVNAQNNIYRVLSPNGGEVLDWSKTYLIRWNSDYNTKVDIALFKNDAFYKWIALNINHYPTAIYWIPSKTISQSDIGNNVFKIAITFKRASEKKLSPYNIYKKDPTLSWVFDKSDAPFSIILEKQPEKINPENTKQKTVAPVIEKNIIPDTTKKEIEKQPEIKVLSPNGGEVLDWSKIYKIKWDWDTDYNAKVDIALFKNDALYKLIKDDVPNYLKTGYSWIPSKTISQSDIGNNVFKIAITFKKDGKDFISDKSDAPFSIILEKQPEKINPENTNINTKGFIVLEEVQNSPKVSCLLPILKQGQKNNAVYLLQIVLYKEGYYPEGLITGFFGLLTQKAVKNFQQSNNLPVTGSIEKASFSKINSLMNKHFSECKLQD